MYHALNVWERRKEKWETTFDGGSLGSRIDEERSQLRYVVWIAEFSESLNLWTQMALLGSPRSMSVWVSDFIERTRECGIEVSRRVSIKSPCPLKDSSIGLAFSIETWVRRLKIIFSFAQTCNSRNKIQSKRWQTINIKSWPQIRQGYPLNLSILISGGKETNKDSLSNGEWSGNSSNLKSPTLASANCSCEKHFLGGSVVPKLLGTVRHRGWQPRLWLGRPLTMCFRRVGLFGNAAQKWW